MVMLLKLIVSIEFIDLVYFFEDSIIKSINQKNHYFIQNISLAKNFSFVISYPYGFEHIDELISLLPSNWWYSLSKSASNIEDEEPNSTSKIFKNKTLIPQIQKLKIVSIKIDKVLLYKDYIFISKILSLSSIKLHLSSISLTLSNLSDLLVILSLLSFCPNINFISLCCLKYTTCASISISEAKRVFTSRVGIINELSITAPDEEV